VYQEWLDNGVERLVTVEFARTPPMKEWPRGGAARSFLLSITRLYNWNR